MTATTSIIIPALNEGTVIGVVVRSLAHNESLRAAGITDIVVVDNGSTDETAAVARAAGARVVWEPRRGYGHACLAGIEASPQADIIVQMDGDGSDVPEQVLRVWEPLQCGAADLVMGSRTRGQHEPGALTPQQIAGNAVGTSLMRVLYGVRLSDIGPLRAIRRETLLRMQMAEMTYGWSAEMLVKAGRLGLRIAEVPVDYRRRAGGESKVAGTISGTLKASRAILTTILRYARWQPALLDHVARTNAATTATSDKRAVFIVARLPQLGHTKTRLAETIGAAATTDLYRAFLRDLGDRFRASSRRAGYDQFWYYTAPQDVTEADFASCVPAGAHFLRQPDGAFGDRLWRGFQALHAQGYTHMVVLSSDSPHVPVAWVESALRQLDTHDIVIGPAHDGGYYLLGQRGTPVDLFTAVPMSTPDVCTQTLDLALQAGKSIAFAPSTFDVDYSRDLVLLHAALEHAPTSGADAAPATLAQLRRLECAEQHASSGVVYAD